MVQTPDGEKIIEMKPGEKIRMTKDEKKELIQALTYAMKDEVLSKCREESFKREFEAWKKANNIQTMKDVDRYIREIRKTYPKSPHIPSLMVESTDRPDSNREPPEYKRAGINPSPSVALLL